MRAGRERMTRLLALDEEHEVAAFERAFYQGFERATHNRLVRWLWEWEDAGRRLRTRIPYAEQRIWVLGGEAASLGAAIAVNVRLQTLQAAAYGFTVPVDLAAAAKAGRVCEFLTFFVVGDRSLTSKHALWTEMFDDLRAAGFTHALATTAPKVLPMYRRMGVEVIGEAAIEGEVRYFLRFDLRRTAGTRNETVAQAAGTE
jgi:hypothetical protein